MSTARIPDGTPLGLVQAGQDRSQVIVDAAALAARIMGRAGLITFSAWGDRPISLRELTAVIVEESKIAGRTADAAPQDQL